jgi:hypothetical protein
MVIPTMSNLMQQGMAQVLDEAFTLPPQRS